MIELSMNDAEIAVANDAIHNMRAIIATDRTSGIRVVLPLDRLAAVKIGQALSSGLAIPDQRPHKEN